MTTTARKIFLGLFFATGFFIHGFPNSVTNIDSLITAGEKYYQNCRYHQALNLFTEVVEAIRNENDTLLPWIYGKIGNVYEDIGDYDNALKNYRLSYYFYKKLNDEIGIATALNQTGNVYYRWGDLISSLEFYEQALNIQKKLNDKQGMCSTLNNIGNIYYSWKNYDKALQNYFEVLDIKKQLRDSTEIPNNLINIGSAYLGLKDFKKAKDYYNKALLLTQKSDDKSMMANCLLNMGVLSFEQKRYQEAISYYNMAYDLLSKLDNKLGMAMVFRNFAETKIKTGNILQAEGYLKQALVLAKAENMTSLVAECYYLYSEIYRQKQDYRLALESYTKYNTLDDSIFNEKARQQLSNLQARYETEKKKKEIQQKTRQIAQKEKQIKEQRLSFFLIFSIFIIIGWFVVYFFRNKTRSKQKLLEEEINRQRQQALSAQMNPHFISNALNSIQKYFLNNDFEKANEFLADFGALIRKVLENSRENLIPLKNEIDYLKLYLSLENLRLDEKFLFNIKLSEGLEPSNLLVPPLILQPYVENAIWHGIAPLPDKGRIQIEIMEKNDFLVCVIEDNGIGINRSKMEKQKYARKKKSLAMDITKERLRLLNHSTKNKYVVTITDISTLNPVKQGTKVEFQMPLIYG